MAHASGEHPCEELYRVPVVRLAQLVLPARERRVSGTPPHHRGAALYEIPAGKGPRFLLRLVASSIGAPFEPHRDLPGRGGQALTVGVLVQLMGVAELPRHETGHRQLVWISDTPPVRDEPLRSEPHHLLDKVEGRPLDRDEFLRDGAAIGAAGDDALDAGAPSLLSDKGDGHVSKDTLVSELTIRLCLESSAFSSAACTSIRSVDNRIGHDGNVTAAPVTRRTTWPRASDVPMTHLRMIRLRCGLRQADVAASAGVSRETVRLLERGGHRPRIATALAITRALGHGDAVFAVFPELLEDA